MSDTPLSTNPYKGVRDFYPEDMAIQEYIFDIWRKTAESFGFVHYEASVLEPANLYKAKGAENEEMVNEQTYTFTDRGDREVTLRPEMTPTVARMIAGRHRTLTFPVRWYSIPNLFRYERMQRGRLREHWQLNCDLFGSDDYTADIELITLAHTLVRNFGAGDDLFEIRINDRAEMREKFAVLGITDTSTQDAITRLNDRFHKISADEYRSELAKLVTEPDTVEAVYTLVSGGNTTDTNAVVTGLRELGITNVKIDRSIARGFNYYTGTIFEIFDISGENNRSMLGGGRYDNLTALFGDEAVSGIGFGMGDVTMRDFLTTHNLLPQLISATYLTIIPTEAKFNLAGQQLAHQLRQKGISVVTDIGTRKLGKKIADANTRGSAYVLILGEDEIQSSQYTIKRLEDGTESTGPFDTLLAHLITVV